MSRRPPQSLNGKSNYHTWKKEIQIWNEVTSSGEAQKAGLIILELKDERAKEAAFNLSQVQRQSAEGVKTLLKVLDDLYDEDPDEDSYILFQKFERIKRKKEECMKGYVQRYTQAAGKLKQKGMILPEGVLCYKFLETATIDEVTERIIRTTATNLTLKDIEKTLLKAFDKHLSINNEDKDEKEAEDEQE